jgi:hypothetical protein
MMVLRGLGWIVRRFLAVPKLVLVIAVVASLALHAATVLSSAVFGLMSGAAALAVGASHTVQGRQAARVAGLQAENARLAREAAGARVTYRGANVAAREAVEDTAARVTRRLTVATTRNVTSMAGEALPVVGIGVIAAATAWEIHDACELLREMGELERAFAGTAPSEDEVCGQEVPTRAELWAQVKASPAAAWDAAVGLYDGLPEWSVSGFYESVLGLGSGAYNYLFGADPQP